jgi:hypothetical protein
MGTMLHLRTINQTTEPRREGGGTAWFRGGMATQPRFGFARQPSRRLEVALAPTPYSDETSCES